MQINKFVHNIHIHVIVFLVINRSFFCLFDNFCFYKCKFLALRCNETVMSSTVVSSAKSGIDNQRNNNCFISFNTPGGTSHIFLSNFPQGTGEKYNSARLPRVPSKSVRGSGGAFRPAACLA